MFSAFQLASSMPSRDLSVCAVPGSDRPLDSVWGVVMARPSVGLAPDWFQGLGLHAHLAAGRKTPIAGDFDPQPPRAKGDCHMSQIRPLNMAPGMWAAAPPSTGAEPAAG